MSFNFAQPSGIRFVLEQEGPFTPRFDQNGLLSAIVVNAVNGDVVMVAYMNAQALALTIETGIAHYYSRSRASLWKKGETSGNIQQIQEIYTDCDQDAVLLKVKIAGDGIACHTGQKSCFYRRIEAIGTQNPMLKYISDT